MEKKVRKSFRIDAGTKEILCFYHEIVKEKYGTARTLGNTVDYIISAYSKENLIQDKIDVLSKVSQVTTLNIKESSLEFILDMLTQTGSAHKTRYAIMFKAILQSSKNVNLKI